MQFKSHGTHSSNLNTLPVLPTSAAEGNHSTLPNGRTRPDRYESHAGGSWKEIISLVWGIQQIYSVGTKDVSIQISFGFLHVRDLFLRTYFKNKAEM